MTDTAVRHQITRVRRDPVRRTVTVASTERLSPHMLRVRLAGPELVGFESAAPDDHIKLFVPAEPGGEELVARDYTPRAFDAAVGTLTVDFAVHEAGPATRWALEAKPGDTLRIGGPKGSAVVPDDFDWYLLIGDETALPAMGRRIEELRADAPVVALVAVETDEDAQGLPEREGLTVLWSPRAGTGEGDEVRLGGLLAERGLPAGDGFVWIGAEGAVARALKAFVIDDLGHPRGWLKASGYWSRGDAGAHVSLKD